ncbi:MAG: Fe-S cluster assembly protein SufD [Bacteroidota bacterium]
MKSLAEQSVWYQATFETFEKSLNGEAGSEFHALRKKALAKFKELGFPTTRHEEWKFTNVTPIARTPFRPVPVGRSAKINETNLRLPDLTENRLVFVDGHYHASLSKIRRLPDKVIAGSLAEALKRHSAMVQKHLGKYVPFDEHPFVALNTAFARDGAFVWIPDGKGNDEPIHIHFIATGDERDLISPRNLFIVGDRGRLSVIESYYAMRDGAYFTNAVTELIVGEGATVEYDKLQDESLDGYHVSWTHSVQSSRSTVTSNLVALGGSIARSNIHASLGGEGCECTLNGLSLGTRTQLIDNHTTIDHATPRCASHELYKAVLAGKSRGVFNGKIFVRKDAQKTDAKQTNKTLLLSDDAVMDTKPQLEIFADDVKCTHGATIGQLDADQVFYLRSRGLDLTSAQDMLTFAFAADVVNRIHAKGLSERLEAMVHEKLHESRRGS